MDDPKVRKILENTIRLDPSYHGWPSLIRLPDGDLLAACSGNRERHVCPFGRVFLYRSHDEGRTWTEPVRLSHGPLDDRDAGLCLAADGSVLMNYFTSTAYITRTKPDDPPHWKPLRDQATPELLAKEHGLWMRRSEDGGRTWSEKYPSPVNNPHGPALLKDGRLFFPGRLPKYPDDTGKPETRSEFRLAAAVSEDHGRTWKVLSQIPAPAGHDPEKCYELNGIQAPDGRIIVQIRDHNDPEQIRTWQTDSFDSGMTWTEPRRIGDGFPTHLLRFGKDRLLMTYSWRKKPCGVRARISDDSGDTWGEELILTDRAVCWDVGYPMSAEMPDGSIFTLWYENEAVGGIAVLKYCRWIPPGKPAR
ncbi:MAG: exo-alpha-sialidase [Lentisphaeria bacterium]|nr:exo-alpha-sialidase [Lentisphaeria bacterium]